MEEGRLTMIKRVFRDAMGKFATGVTVVTTEHNNEIAGMTVNAFMSISLQPQLIAVSIGDQASMYETLQQTKKFGVSILTEKQKELSMIFAKQIESEQEIPYIKQAGIPVIENSLAMLSCEVKETIQAGDHMIFIAEVTKLSMNDGDPLLYANGNYCTIDSE